MSLQQDYIEKQGWHYVGTQDNLVFYLKDGKLETMRLNQVPVPEKTSS